MDTTEIADAQLELERANYFSMGVTSVLGLEAKQDKFKTICTKMVDLPAFHELNVIKELVVSGYEVGTGCLSVFEPKVRNFVRAIVSTNNASLLSANTELIPLFLALVQTYSAENGQLNNNFLNIYVNNLENLTSLYPELWVKTFKFVEYTSKSYSIDALPATVSEAVDDSPICKIEGQDGLRTPEVINGVLRYPTIAGKLTQPQQDLSKLFQKKEE